MNNDTLSVDEYDALQQIAKLSRTSRLDACVSRNVKRLAGLKFVSYSKDSTLQLTEKGVQTLFIRRCIDALRAVSADPQAQLDAEVQLFLSKKGHIAPLPNSGGFALTQRGTESLADIDFTAR